VVSAIGQVGDLAGLEALDNGKGFISADASYRVPEHEGYFVAGDIVRPHLLTTAIGQAAIAVEAVDKYLQDLEPAKRPKVDVHHFDLLAKLREAGMEPQKFEPANEGPQRIDKGVRGTSAADFAVHNFENRSAHEVVPADELFLGHWAEMPRVRRGERVPDAGHVIGDFAERIVALSEELAVKEAERCMSCGLCFECDNCMIFCPQDAVFRVRKGENTTGRYVDTGHTRCIRCHICADVCPSGYIDMGMGR